jgi:protein involved in polysaccharide export with SLBB domain
VHVTISRTAILLCAALASAGCAVRSAPSTRAAMVPAPGLIWKLEEGDMVKTKVYTSPDLSSEAIVNSNGTAFFPAVGRIPVAGLTVDSLETLLNTRYSTQVVRNAAVQVTMTRDITLYGQVRSPGIYAADPTMTLIGLMARAGGPSSFTTTPPDVFIETSSGQRLTLPREARLGSIDVHRRDAIYFDEQSFSVRNGPAIAATSLVVNIISAMLSLVFLATR